MFSKVVLFLGLSLFASSVLGFGTEVGKDRACSEKPSAKESFPSACHAHYYDARQVCYFGAKQKQPSGSIKTLGFHRSYCAAHAEVQQARTAAGMGATNTQDTAKLMSALFEKNGGINQVNSNTGPLLTALHKREAIHGQTCAAMSKNCVSYCGATSAAIVSQCKQMAAQAVKINAMASQMQILSLRTAFAWKQSQDQWNTEAYKARDPRGDLIWSAAQPTPPAQKPSAKSADAELPWADQSGDAKLAADYNSLYDQIMKRQNSPNSDKLNVDLSTEEGYTNASQVMRNVFGYEAEKEDILQQIYESSGHPQVDPGEADSNWDPKEALYFDR